MNNQPLKILLFRWGDAEFGIEIQGIQEVLKFENTHPVPLAPPYMDRFLNLRGKVIAVCFLNQLFKIRLAEKALDPRVLVLRDNEVQAGLYVDSVSDVFFPDPSSLGVVPETLSKRKSGFFFKGELAAASPGVDRKVLLFDSEALSKFLKEIRPQWPEKKSCPPSTKAPKVF